MASKISVIVPIYNVEKYLCECVESLIHQSYSDLEIILINDGSTDNCGALCDGYADKDDRIVVIHQENAGAGAAKNAGLNAATGDYIGFADSDDVVKKDMFKTLLNNMTDDIDIVQCSFSQVYTNGVAEQSTCVGDYTAADFLLQLLQDWRNNVFWNKLFKAKLLKNVRFPVGRTIDDEFFTYKAIGNAKNIKVIPQCLYEYRMRKSSVMNDGKKNRLVDDRIDYLSERYDYICSRYPKLKGEFKYQMADYITILSQENKVDDVQKKIKLCAEKYNFRLEQNIFDKLNVKIRDLTGKNNKTVNEGDKINTADFIPFE